MRQASPNFRFPRIGAHIRILQKGFNPERVGILTGKTEKGLMILNMDDLNLLPDGHPNKVEILSPFDEFEVL